jgi:hypothetical protein
MKKTKKSKINLKTFFRNLFSGIGLGLIVSGMVNLTQNGLDFLLGWFMTIFGVILYMICETYNKK